MCWEPSTLVHCPTPHRRAGRLGRYPENLLPFVFDHWRTGGKLTLPFRYIEKIGGVILQDLRATSITVDGQLDDSVFIAPAGLMIVAWFPKEKILFEADMLDITYPGQIGTGERTPRRCLRRSKSLGWP